MDKVIPYYFSILQDLPLQKNHQMAASDDLQLSFPRAHFDGAAKDGICACGVFIAISIDLQFSLYWNCGKGSSKKAEAMALHGLLLFCTFMDIGLYGNSKIIIDHVKGNHAIQTDSLSGWLARIASLWKPATFPISHIRRKQNEQADVLSKKGTHTPFGAAVDDNASDAQNLMQAQVPSRRDLSCTTCFDALWFCYSPVHQMQQYYRGGTFDNCFDKWNALFDCFHLKTKPSSEMQAILESREKDAPHIWTFRTTEEASREWNKVFGHLNDD